MTAIDENKTLKELINEAFKEGLGKDAFGKNPSEFTAAADNLTIWFSTYFGGTADKKDPKKITLRKNILDKTLSNIRKEADLFFTYIRDGLRSYPKNKYQPALKIRHLLMFLNKKYETDFYTEFVDDFRNPDKNMRLLEILKLLHNNEISKSEIAETFEITERSLNKDLSDLRKGIEFMGAKMKINEERRDNNSYISPNHPIFLTMNSAEIYALTIGLKLLSKDTVFQRPHDKIANQIYSQLSDFGRNMIDEQAIELGIYFNIQEREFKSSLEMVQQDEIAFCQYLRDSRPCEVHYIKDGEPAITVGTLHIPKEGQNKMREIVIKNSEGEKLIRVRDVKKIIPVL